MSATISPCDQFPFFVINFLAPQPPSRVELGVDVVDGSCCGAFFLLPRFSIRVCTAQHLAASISPPTRLACSSTAPELILSCLRYPSPSPPKTLTPPTSNPTESWQTIPPNGAAAAAAAAVVVVVIIPYHHHRQQQNRYHPYLGCNVVQLPVKMEDETRAGDVGTNEREKKRSRRDSSSYRVLLYARKLNELRPWRKRRSRQKKLRGVARKRKMTRRGKITGRRGGGVRY